MTPEKLSALTRKELAELAKTHQVTGWHGMRKHQLVDALARLNGKAARRGKRGERSAGRQTRPTLPANGQRLRRSAKTGAAARRRLIQSTHERDRLKVNALDSHWMHAEWQLTKNSVERAQAALGTDWHQARLVLRVFDITTDDSSFTNRRALDVEIRGETEHWYVSVPQSGRSYKLHIGFLGPNDRFITLARSPRVNVPAQRPGANSPNGNGSTQAPPHSRRPARRTQPIPLPVADEDLGDFEFSIDTEVTIVGSTVPGARLTIHGETIRVGEDGTFSLRVALEEGRQVLPAVAITPDGAQERTIILAMERNMKELEPQALDGFSD